MRNFLYILLSMAFVWQMTGCSYREEFDIPDEASMPVEFAFSSTKGMIGGIEDLVDGSSTFGMFAVKAELFGDPTGDLTVSDGLDIRNELCTFVAQTESAPAALRFGYVSDRRNFYYPMGADASYTFHTYHQYNKSSQTLNEMSASKRQIKVIMDVATVNDILYSESVVSKSYDEDGGGLKIEGFNAPYIRKTGNVPTFRLKHPVAAVRIRMVLEPDSRETIPVREYFMLTGMSLTNSTGTLPVKAALCIADLDNPDNNGTFVDVVETSAGRAWKTADNNTGNLNVDILNDTDGDGVASSGLDVDVPIQLGGVHFIMPQDDPLEVTLSFEHRRYTASGSIAGNWKMTKTVTLDPAAAGATEGGYDAGMIYSYLIRLKYVNDTPGNPANNDVELTVEADYEN